MKNSKTCEGYVAVRCIDGSCPIALRDEYQEYGIPVVWSCEECVDYDGGCENCIFEGTDVCIKK